MLSRGNQAVVEPIAETREPWARRIQAWLLARWLPLGLFFATFALFSPALRNQLLNWDDTDNFIFNPHFRGLGWQQLKWMWTSCHLGPYQPLSWMTLGFDYLVWGVDSEGDLRPRGYYLGNILLHSLNVFLVYCVGCRLLRFARGLPALETSDAGEVTASSSSDGTLKLCAAFGALLFGWHPLRVESVAWATERRDVLSSAFLLGSLIWYLRMAAAEASDQPNSTSKRRWAYHISWLLYVASLLSKAMGMTLPVVLLILDVYPLRRLPANPREWFRSPESRHVLWQRLREKFPYMLASVCCMVVALYGQRHFAGLRRAEYPISARLAQSAYGLAWYSWKILWPSDLCALYPLEVNPDPREPQFWGSGLAVAAAFLVLWIARRRLPSALAAACAYTVLISPLLGLAQSGPQIVADRYTYLPSIPWVMFAAGALWWWLEPPTRNAKLQRSIPANRRERNLRNASLSGENWEPISAEAHPWRFRIARAGGLIILVALAGLTLRQLTFWGSSIALWTRALNVSDFNPIAHHNLGLVLGDVGKMDEAFAHMQKAIDQRPTYLDAFLNRGILYEQEKRHEEAAADLRRACELSPNSTLAHYNLALVLTAMGDDQGADVELQKAISLSPEQESTYRDAVKSAREHRESEKSATKSASNP